MRIVISGTVGVGKSTVSTLLETELKKSYPVKDVKLIKEDTVESIYLQHYYDSPQDWAFIAQVDFLFERFKNWLKDEKERTEKGNDSKITIYDRHFLDDYIFAELHSIKENISNLNSLTYQAIYKEVLEKMHRFDAEPDIFFLLKAPLETVIDRFKSRNRKEERDVDLEYWKHLYHNYYDRPMFKNHFKINTKKVVVIDTENRTPKQIVDKIIEEINNL